MAKPKKAERNLRHWKEEYSKLREVWSNGDVICLGLQAVADDIAWAITYQSGRFDTTADGLLQAFIRNQAHPVVFWNAAESFGMFSEFDGGDRGWLEAWLALTHFEGRAIFRAWLAMQPTKRGKKKMPPPLSESLDDICAYLGIIDDSVDNAAGRAMKILSILNKIME